MTTNRVVTVCGALVLFIVLATANSGGYRFGVSDQAFYEPAIRLRMDPTLFPRDRPLLEAQTRFMVSDRILGDIARVLPVDLPPLFFAVYLLTLALLSVSAMAVARGLGFSSWATTALLLALTLRHRIAKTGANSLEGYMHTRQLAFALGGLGLAFVLRRRHGWMLLSVVAAGAIHPTTGLWFAVLLVPTLWCDKPAWRPYVLGAAGVAILAAAVALVTGPMASRLHIMDAAWLTVLADKDYLFPSAWPAYAWILNLAYLPVTWLVFRQRRASGAALPIERSLMYGLGALVAVFLVSVPFTAAHVALAVQLQVTRVFWVLDFVATVYGAWWLTSSPWLIRIVGGSRLRVAAVAVLAAVSISRGYYLLDDQAAGRQLVRVNLRATPWTDALAWLRTQPKTWQVLADPGHAWKYGISVRVGAERDTVLESVKDSALAMYDRDVAMRVADRSAALMYFQSMTARDLRGLGAAYDINAVIVEQTRAVDLPVLYRNSGFVIYALR